MKLSRPRLFTLVLGVPVSLALIGWTSFSFVALAGTGTLPVDQTFALRNNTLSEYISQGSVTLVPESGDAARLTGTVKYSLIKPQMSLSPNGIDFNCPVPTGFCDFTSTLTVPPAAAVKLSAGLGDLTVNGGITGALSLSTTAGNVTASGVTSGDVSVHSVAGDITLQFSKAPASVSVRSDVGNITVVLPGNTTYRVIASSTAGNSSVDVPTSNSSQHVIDVTSEVGDITLSTG